MKKRNDISCSKNLSSLLHKITWKNKGDCYCFSAIKIGEHIPCRYSTIWAFDNIENKHSFFRVQDYTKKFCTSLREHATNVINLENYCYRWQKKNWNHIKTQKYIIFVEKESWKSLLMIKIIEKWGAIVILQVIIEAQYIVFVS